MFDPDKPWDVRTNFPGGVNTSHEDIYAHMRRNVKRHIPQAHPWPANQYRAMLLCGGPSLSDHLDEIKRKRRQGWKVITVNGTHDWALDHGIRPSLFLLVDARQFNVRFVKRPQKKCRYMIASQAHPDVFDALEGYDLHIWHAGENSPEEGRILNRHYAGRWASVPGGTSIGTRAIGMAWWLGIRTIDVYGFDCCYRKKQHHAYEQPENNYGTPEWTVKIGRRTFACDPWMVRQCDDMCQFGETLPDNLKLTFHGDGMLSYLIKETAAGRNPRRSIRSNL